MAKNDIFQKNKTGSPFFCRFCFRTVFFNRSSKLVFQCKPFPLLHPEFQHDHILGSLFRLIAIMASCLYRLTFILFGMSFIFPSYLLPLSNYRLLCASLLFLANVIIVSYTVYSTVIYTYVIYSSNVALTVAAAEIISSSIVIVHRCILSIRITKLKYISKIMNSLDVKEKSSLCLYAWIIISILIIAVKCMSSLNKSDENVFIIHLCDLFNHNSLFCKIIPILNIFQSSILMDLPLNTFAIFYVNINNQLRYELKKFSKEITLKQFSNHRSVLCRFYSIRDTMNFIDKELSFFVFCEILHSSTMLFFTVSGILRWTAFSSCFTCHDRLAFLSQLCNTVLISFMLTTSACMVSETYSEIGYQIKALTLVSDMNLREQQECLCIDKGACLTVWKIIPITRGFIFSTIGTILTYTMLFDNLFSN